MTPDEAFEQWWREHRPGPMLNPDEWARPEEIWQAALRYVLEEAQKRSNRLMRTRLDGSTFGTPEPDLCVLNMDDLREICGEGK